MIASSEQACRILIIDDSVANIRLLGSLLKDKGEILFATSGEAGIEIARQQPPQLILLDVEMPSVDGYEVCRRLKADPATSDCAIMFVTSHRSAEHEVAALEAGAVDFISKPLNPPVVRARVQTQLTVKQQAEQLQQQVNRDGLTGLYNRRYFDGRLEAEWRRHQRMSAPLGLIMIDIDHFKAYNDGYGHLEGDACLQRISEVLKVGTRRSGEVVARFGGEEFVVILPNISLDEAEKYGGWICDQVRSLELPHKFSNTADIVTISVGVASCVPDPCRAPIALIEQADQALYRAKAAGRNRLEVAE